VAWRGLEKSLTIWEYSQIVKAYREGTIIIIDEVTKTRPGARAILNDLMQSKEIELPDGQRVKRGEGFQIIATMNEAKEPYGGYELGEDFEDRFGAILEVRELPKEKRVEFLKRTAIVPLKTGIQKKGNGELDSSFSLTTLGTGRGNDEPLQSTVPEEFIKELVEMQERINASGKVWRKMSLRVLERIIEAIQKYPDEDIGEIIRAEYRIGDWEGGREFVEKEIQALTKKEWVEKDWKKGTPLTGPTGSVQSFTWSNDGTTLFSIGDTNEIFYWKLPQPKSGVLERAKAQAKSIPYSPPQIIENGLISDEVRIPIGSDTDYPGTEYEYAPKETPTNNKIIHQILLGISLGRNVLVIGPVGTGKSWLTKAVFRMLHRKVEHMSLHEGTTTRDLTCWPKTKSENNNDGSHSISTDYELSPLARAMLEGRPFIADEVNRATPGVLAVLNHALQFKELILPREIELTLPDGRKILTNRIKAKQGFSLVMTMNPPGGRVEVNDMMADFMDRMYGVEIGYLPEEEEVDLLMRIAGKGNEILRKDIETLVSYANNMRKTSLKKPSFRALERIVESIKHYPNQDPIELLEQKMGMALRPKAERESLAVALLAKEFGKTFKKVVPIAKNVALRAVTKIGAVAALSMNLATGNKDEDGEEKYNPERWWEVGNPSLQDQGRARERRRVLERVMQITTGLGIPLKAWYPIPEAGELGMMRTWRCIWNTKDMKPREMNFVAEDMIQPGSEESVLGVLYHELFELLYRHPEASSSEFLSKLGAALLDNGVGDIWINLKGIEDFVGSRNWLMARYDETYSPTRYGKSLEEHQILMAQQPLYFQFTLGVIYEWVYGKKDPTILNQQVLDAIETLQDRAKEVYLTKEVAEHKKKMEELYDTEEFQALVQKSIEDKAQSKAIAGGKGGEGKEAGDRIPWEKLSDQEKKELLQQLKKAWDSLSPEEKLELLKQAKQELGEKDKNRPEIAPPLMVGEDGNPLDKDKLKEAIQSLKESIERAQEEQDRYDEEQEQKRLEEEEEAAKRDKEERDREGITEKEQADYNARYERVQTDVNRMKTVFRKFYQRQVGYWQRWREKGMLDDAALPLAVAGEDLIFKQRKIPKQYKVRISLLIDQSGSMDGAKIEAAADAVLMMLLAIQEDQKKGIILEVVGFHDNLPMEFYFKYGEKLNKQKVVEVMSKVAKTYLGNNDLRAMYHAFKRIPLKEKNTLNLVIHFSDGDPNFQFSRDRFRKWINSKPHIVVVGLGIGKGAELILDLYHKGQGVWAESTRDVPAKMQQVLERFIGRHGRNGPETIRYSADDIAESETKAHTRTQFLAEFRNGGIPASIFYPYYLKGRIRNPSHLGERFHNLLYWLGEPKVVAPIWEETLFRVLPIILISSLGFNTQELLYTSSLLGWMTFGFALSHIMVRWVIRANDQNWDKGILLWNYKEKEDWPNFIKYLIPALLFSLIYIVSLNFLPLPSSILNHLVPYFIVVLAHGLYSAALLKNLLPELLTPSLNSHPKNSNESEKNITKTKEKIENEIELIVKQELSPFSYGSYQINQAAIQAESNTKQFPLHLIDFPEDMAIEEDGFDLPQKYQDWILGLVKFISLHSSSENNRNPKIGFIVQSNQAKRIIQTMLLELEIPEEMVLFTVQTPEQAVNLAIEKNASIVTLFTDRPENEYWKQTVKWAITLSSGDELKVRGKELKILKNMLQGKLSGKNGKILFKDNELILQKETLGLELNKTEEYHRQTLHFKFQA
ncbi:MAG TPA: AAA family ATPase, partial [Candidatus Nanoarchaeia archaeon]|nr:AAA family ATPase [Candidatus Nanoarchaeia archaeon]